MVKGCGKAIDYPNKRSNAVRKDSSVYIERFSLHCYFLNSHYLFISHSLQQCFRNNLYALTSLLSSINVVFGEC